MQAIRSGLLPLTPNQIGRYVAALFGLIALGCFYQPWVSASLPNVGESVLTGMEIARGEAAERVDAASAPAGVRPGPGATSAPVAGGAASGATSGGLTLPTRVPTVAAGAGASGGLVLPTRIATAGPGAPGEGAGVALATAAAATREAFSTAQARGGAAATTFTVERAPDKLPTLSLYLVPLAAAGLAIFAAIWDRLREPRDRLYGKIWTILLAAGGALGVGSVLYKIATAPSTNNLLAPGAVKAPLWGLWGTFLAFAIAAVSLAVAWLSPSPSKRAA
jgi:hypothetical protein